MRFLVHCHNLILINTMKKFISLFFAISLSFAVQAQTVVYNQVNNIQYYESANDINDAYKQQKCLLDIYYPESEKKFPVVVWFHGGGLTSGTKEIPEALKNKGFLIVGVDYRLSPNVKAEDCISDATAAVAWVFKNIEKYNGDSKSIFISGHSAGGYLSLMVGMNKKLLKEYDIDADTIAGFIPFSGHTITHFTIRAENGIEGTQPIVDEFAPLYYVRKNTPPILLITGDRELEMLGRYEENAYFYRMMKVVGNENIKILELDGYGHNMAEPAFPLLIDFINKKL